MQGIDIFTSEKFGSIRAIEESGRVLFCGSDVARALGYARPNDAIVDHCRCTVKRRIPHPQSPNKEIGMAFIPEGDVYRLIARSKLPSAERFERWIFDEVLPSIRESIGLKQHEALLLLSRENQKRGNQKLYEVGLREKSDYCKAAKIAGKATANCMHKDKAVSKKDVPEDFLPLYDGLFEDTVFLMCMKERFGMDFSVSEAIYRKWGILA